VNLFDEVDAALTRLNEVKRQPTDANTEAMPALNAHLRKLKKQVDDKKNRLPWNKEKKKLLVLSKKIGRALSNWEHETTSDVSRKRIKELEHDLSRPLNNSQRRKRRKELRRIAALRQALERG
jgi:GTPase involved in cell partitioning and DNA repair